MIEYFFKKYEGKVGRNFIQNLYNTLNEVKSLLFHNDDLEEQMEKYINLEVLQREIELKIANSKIDLKNISNSKYSIINKQIIQKRNEGELFKSLRKLDEKNLFELKHLVDIDKEVEIVEEENFQKAKELRRGKSNKSYSIGGSHSKGVLL
jgi:hypothetical protein